MKRAVAGMVSALAIGCGGGSPPPAKAPASSAAADPVLSSGPPTPPAAAPSPELLAGIKAFDAGRFADARASFEAASRRNPTDSEALFNLGLACEKLDDKACAEKSYRAALAAKPDLDAASAELSALYIDQGRPADAVAVARAALLKRPASAPLHENLGVALAMQGDRDAALRELEQAARATPNDPMVELTFAHWLNVFHADGARAHLDVALGLAKDDYGMIASVGHEYRMAGAFDACVKTFDRAVALKDGGEVRTERGLCRHGLKDDRGALDDFVAGVAAEPTYAPAHYYLGGRLAEARRFKEAAAEYRKVVDLDPNGSLAKPAAERMKAAQAMAREGAAAKKK